VNTYAFIFSKQLRYRIPRHVIFWVIWWVFFLSSYLIPKNYFPDWNVSENTPALQQLGLFKYYLFILVNSSRGLLFQIIFTYVLIYILLPRYLIKEKYTSLAIAGAISLGIIIIAFTYVGKYTHHPICRAFGLPGKMPAPGYFLNCAVDNILFNIPTAAGIALSIKLLKHWYQKQKEAQQLITSKANAELQLLKAQVHPHFLFNTLNNIYSFILTSSPKAPEMIKKLSGLLRYIIHECNQPGVPLEKELKMIRDYISLETIRYGEQFDITVDISGELSNKKIAPLLLLPFVENSFKHGTSKTLSKPWVNLDIIIEDTKIYFMLNNSKPLEYISPNRNGGIGLSNVQKRLQLLYPGRHELKMGSEPDHFTVLLEMDLQAVNEKPVVNKIRKETLKYEMA
jgi:hypothetical protein